MVASADAQLRGGTERPEESLFMVLENKFMNELTQLGHQMRRLIKKKNLERPSKSKVKCFRLLETDISGHSTQRC